MSNTSPEKNKRRVTLLAGGAFHAFHDGLADGLVVFFPLWQPVFNLSLTQVGLLATCFDGVTGIFQIPAGFLGERTGERLPLLAGTLVTAISFICMGFVSGILTLVCFLLIGGLGAAVQHPLAAAMVSSAYPAKGRRVALGTYNFSGDIGKFVFPATAAAALSFTGWRTVCVGFGLFGCLLTMALFLLLNHSRVGEGASIGKQQHAVSAPQGWGIVNKSAFSTLLAIGVVDTAVRVGLITFGPFLFIQKGIEAKSVGFALSVLFIGGAIGKFICGILAERLGIIATVVMTECITGFGILILTVLPFPYIYFFLPVLGAALNGTSSVLYGTVAEFVDPGRMARAFGIFYTFVIASFAVAAPFMGRMSDVLGVNDSIRLIGLIAFSTVPMAAVLSYLRSK